MKTIIFAMIVAVAGVSGCASHGKTVAAASDTNLNSVAAAPSNANSNAVGGTNELSDLKEKRSYAIGMSFGRTFQTQGVEVDTKALVRGITDYESGNALLTMDQMRDVLTEYQKAIFLKRQQLVAEVAATNKEISEAFFATNKNNPGVMTMPDGLQYIVLTNGTGEQPGSNDIVTLNYRRFSLDGKENDSSYKRGHPAQFSVGSVVHGWSEALLNMKVGSKWKVFIPPSLGFGDRGVTGVPPNSVVIIEMELLSVEHPKPQPPITSDIVKVPSLQEMQKGAKIEVIKSEDAAKAQTGQTNAPPK